MTPLLASKDVGVGVARVGEYTRHRPEQTRLYQFVEQYHAAFEEHLAAREREFEEYLKCGRLELRFLRGRCAGCHADRLVAFCCKRCGWLRASRPSPAPAV